MLEMQEANSWRKTHIGRVRVSQQKCCQRATVCVRSLSALQSEVTGIFPMATGCNFNSLDPSLMLLKQRHKFEKERSHVMKKTGKIHFPGGEGSWQSKWLNTKTTLLSIFTKVSHTVPSRILLWVIHLFFKSFSGENKHSLFPGIKAKQAILRQLAGQAGHSPGSLWGCPLCLLAWQVSLRRGAHQLLSAMAEARHLRHEWWQSQGFLAGTFLCPAPLAVLCHPTACTESTGQPQPRHWALDHRGNF